MAIKLNSLQGRKDKVENLLEQVDFLKKTSGDGKRQYILDRVQALKNLQRVVFARENAFYRLIGVSGLEQLEQRISRIPESSLLGALSDRNDSRFYELVESAKTGEIINYSKVDLEKEIEGEVIKTEGLAFDLMIQEEAFKNEIAVEPSKEWLVNAFSQRTKEMKDIGEVKHYISSSSNIGLSKAIFNVTASQKKSKKGYMTFTVTVEGDELTPRWKNRLQKDLNKYNLQFDTIGGKTPKEAILYLLQKWRRENSHPIDQIIIDLIEKKADFFDINSSSGSIIGFLGEIRAAALAQFLTDGKIEAVPTGVMRKVDSKQEIPIDLIIQSEGKQIGFQVKNYTTVSGKINLKNSKSSSGKFMSINNFLETRLRTPHAPQLRALFASFHYNIVDQSSENAVQQFTPVRERIKDYVLNYAPKYFDSYIDNIIKLSDEFQVQDNAFDYFTSLDTYYNTFFVMEKSLVPSSAIIEALMQLLHRESSKVISSSYKIIDADGSAENIKGITKEKEKSVGEANSPLFPEKGKGKFNKALDHITISYNISFDINELVELAKKMVKKRRQFV